MLSSVSNNRSVLVCIEGLDGAGKTVQANLLADYLRQRGNSILMVDFPQYDSFFGTEIGAYLSGRNVVDANQLDVKSMSLWYAMDRWNNLKKVDLTQFNFVIFNRFTLSNAVYQGARTPAIFRADMIKWIFDLEHTQLSLPVPDLYIFLDVPIDISNKLNDQKGERNYIGNNSDVYEKDLTLQENVRTIYFQMAKELQNIDIISCIEHGVLLSPKAISIKVLQSLQAFLQ